MENIVIRKTKNHLKSILLVPADVWVNDNTLYITILTGNDNTFTYLVPNLYHEILNGATTLTFARQACKAYKKHLLESNFRVKFI